MSSSIFRRYVNQETVRMTHALEEAEKSCELERRGLIHLTVFPDGWLIEIEATPPWPDAKLGPSRITSRPKHSILEAP